MAEIKFTKISNLEYTSSYYPLVAENITASLGAEYLRSYAKIDFTDLETISGYIDNVEIYTKQNTDIGGYNLIKSTNIVPNNLFVSSSNNIFLQMGNFPNLNIFAEGVGYNGLYPFWSASYYNVPSGHISPTGDLYRQAIDYNPTLFCLKTCGGGSNYYGFNPTVGKYIYSSTTGEYGQIEPRYIFLNLYKNNEYELTFNINGQTIWGIPGTQDNIKYESGINYTGQDNDAIIQFIISGSSISSSFGVEKTIAQLQISSSIYNGTTLIGESSVGNFVTEYYYRNFGQQTFRFTPQNDGIAYLKIKILNGLWNISNLQIKSVAENGYNPNHTYIITEMPTIQHNDSYDFKVQYYTHDSKKSKNISYVPLKYFSGRTFSLPSGSVGGGNGSSGTSGINGSSGTSGVGTIIYGLDNYVTKFNGTSAFITSSIYSSTSGNVGIINSTPQNSLDISSSIDSFGLNVGGVVEQNNWIGISFGYSAPGAFGTGYRKAGIAFKRTESGGNARGDIHILNSNVDDASMVTISDKVATFKQNGIIHFQNQSRCRVYSVNNQILTAIGWELILFDNINYDTQTEFLYNSHGPISMFTALESGYYQVNSRCYIDDKTDGEEYIIGIFVDGSLYSMGQQIFEFKNTCRSLQVSDIVYLNSSSTIDIRVFSRNTTPTILGGEIPQTYLSIHKLS